MHFRSRGRYSTDRWLKAKRAARIFAPSVNECRNEADRRHDSTKRRSLNRRATRDPMYDTRRPRRIGGESPWNRER